MRAQELPNDSISKVRTGIHVNMKFLYTGYESVSYDPLLGITTRYHDNYMGLGFRPALRLTTKRGNAMEFMLEQLYFTVDDDATVLVFDTITGTTVLSGEKVTRVSIGPRYEFNFIFLKKMETNLKPYLGISSELFFRYTENKPAVSNLFHTSSSSLGTVAWVVPGVLINHNKKYYFTLSFPVDLGSFTIRTMKTDNPALPENTRKTTTFDYDYLSAFRVSLAYGIYLN